MHYRIVNSRGELIGNFAYLSDAKAEAERLCKISDRKEHFMVVRIEEVWTTSTFELGQLQTLKTL